jgi:outer membrane translocation and assembly module TamA
MLDLKVQAEDPEFEKQNFFISSAPVGMIYDSRDSVLNPKRGTYFKAEAETALKALGSELQFIRPVAELRHVIPFPWLKEWYLAGKVKAGFVIPLPSNEPIPLIRRFFGGGADSVRGYPYQKLGHLDAGGKPFGGEAAFEGSLELRFPIYKELGGVLFIDGGNVYRDIYADWETLRFTAGAGLRYQTPVGPLRLDFGYQLNPPEHDAFDPYQFYLSVGQAF